MIPLLRLPTRVLLIAFFAPLTALEAAPPKVTALYPAGVMRGAAVDVSASGSFDNWPPGIDIDGAGLVVEPLGDKGRLRLRADADAELGVRWIRFHDAQGASSPRPFIIGWAPEAMEAEPNDQVAQAGLGDAATMVFNGKLEKAGDVDCFSVRLEAGQTLVAAIEAHRRLGSPMDAVLQLTTDDGFVLTQCDDDAGFDPLLAFAATTSGRHVVRLFAFPSQPNSTIGFAGGEDFVYRLTLTTGPCADRWQPLAVQRGETAQLAPVGWNLENGWSATLTAGAWMGQRQSWIAPLALPAATVWVPWEVLAEASLTSASAPQSLPFPCSVSGQLDPPGDIDVYKLSAPAGQPLRIAIDARNLGRPVDSVLRVRRSNGEKLAEADDAGENRDAALQLNAPADGELLVEVSDLFDRGGWRNAYLLSVAPVKPEVALSLAVDALVLPADKPAELTVAINRQDGFAQPVTVAILGLPPGVNAKPVESPATGDTAKAVKLTLERSPDAGAWSGPIEVVGSVPGPPPVQIPGQFVLPGDGRSSRLWLTVIKSK